MLGCFFALAIVYPRLTAEGTETLLPWKTNKKTGKLRGGGEGGSSWKFVVDLRTHLCGITHQVFHTGTLPCIISIPGAQKTFLICNREIVHMCCPFVLIVVQDNSGRDGNSCAEDTACRSAAAETRAGGNSAAEVNAGPTVEGLWGRGGMGGGVTVVPCMTVVCQTMGPRVITLPDQRRRVFGGGGVLTSCMTGVLGAIDPRIPAMPGRKTSGFRQPGRRCWHQARSAVRNFAEANEGLGRSV